MFNHKNTAKVIAIFALAAAVAFRVSAEEATPTPTLLGVAKLGERSCAVLEIPAHGRRKTVTQTLSEGEREGDVEVLAIDIGRQTVELRCFGSNVVLQLHSKAPVDLPGAYEINLTNAPLHSVIQLLAQVSNRSMLLHPQLPSPAPKIAVRGSGADARGAEQILLTALDQNDIAALKDGEKFCLIVQKNLATAVQPKSALISKPQATSPDNELIPAGYVVLNGTDGTQTARMAAAMLNRTLDTSSLPVSTPLFFFRNQSALTRAEMKYALDVLLEWRGWKIVAVDDKLARLERIETKTPAR